MAKEKIQQISEYVALYRDPKTGIAWIEDGGIGLSYSAHPNIHHTGSIRGMKDRGFWGKKDRCVHSHGYIYNIDVSYAGSKFGKIAREHCQCGGKH